MHDYRGNNSAEMTKTESLAETLQGSISPQIMRQSIFDSLGHSYSKGGIHRMNHYPLERDLSPA